MRDVKVMVISSIVDGFPAGTVFGNLHIALVDKSDASKVLEADIDDATGPSEFTFLGVPVGSYTVTAKRLDSAGATLGDVISQDIDVVDVQTVSGSIPSTMLVTLQ